jgi:hypothetical protein
MIHECTDCKHCADFDGGWRVICLEPGFPPEKVCDYFPVGDDDAFRCGGFEDREYDDMMKKDFTAKDWDAAEKYSVEVFGEVEYKGIREWVEKRLRGEL